jgi:hypothetical protein
MIPYKPLLPGGNFYLVPITTRWKWWQLLPRLQMDTKNAKAVSWPTI